MRGAITLTGERIHSSNYVAPTNFCPSVNLRNSRRRICAREGLRGERMRSAWVGGYGWPFRRFPHFPAFTSGSRRPCICRTHRQNVYERRQIHSQRLYNFYIRWLEKRSTHQQDRTFRSGWILFRRNLMEIQLRSVNQDYLRARFDAWNLTPSLNNQ